MSMYMYMYVYFFIYMYIYIHLHIIWIHMAVYSLGIPLGSEAAQLQVAQVHIPKQRMLWDSRRVQEHGVGIGPGRNQVPFCLKKLGLYICCGKMNEKQE